MSVRNSSLLEQLDVFAAQNIRLEVVYDKALDLDKSKITEGFVGR